MHFMSLKKVELVHFICLLKEELYALYVPIEGRTCALQDSCLPVPR